MDVFALPQIEEIINRLSPSEQLWLMERLAHRLRASAFKDTSDLGHELDAMAADPEIQRELHEINQEFLITELDGLEDIA